MSNIEEKVEFLNAWLCRADRKTVIPDLRECRKEFNSLLHQISPLDLICLNSEEISKRAYDLLASVNGLGPTGISKYLHMHKPDLFIMWDNQIFRDYFHIKTVLKTTATPRRYLKFMLRMRDEMLEAISSFASLSSITETQATLELQKYFKNDTFPRILDKHNYVTRGQPKQLIH